MPGSAAGVCGLAEACARSKFGNQTTSRTISTAETVSASRECFGRASRLRLRVTGSVMQEPSKVSRSGFPGDGIVSPLLEKDIAEIGAMNLAVSHGAGLILGRLVMRGPGRTHRREGVALQAEHVHWHDLQHPRI